ncbi:hypothetical protein [uncultured Roseobacter sp.]|uniref:hypothetical protein n=1 Tax=uncultured Roseobacter sp. TaxID=114847 RepID=UPI00260C7E95|nr:hypothetical protein [uncultured Roseobacter sp.]
MTFDRGSKYLLIIGVTSFLWWLEVIDETALGLKPSDLNGFVPPFFLIYFIFGTLFFFLSKYLPYLILAGALATLIAWWKAGRKWKWTAYLVSLVLAGVASAFSLFTGTGNPLHLAIAAILIVVFVIRIRGHRMSCWIDRFGKLEVLFLTIAVIGLLPDWDWSRVDQRNRSPRPTVEIPPYATRYAREMSDNALDAAARFTDPQSCLVAGTENLQSPEPLMIDWARISWTAEAEVCIFRLLSALGGIEASRSFMEAQGFRMPPDNFSPENPYVHDDALRITAYWSIRNNGPKFPTRGVMDRLRAAAPYSMVVNVYFSQDGSRVLAVQIGYNTV